MDKFIEKLKRYLYEILHIDVKFRPWKSQNDLPLFLINSYYFYEISLLGQPCLLMINQQNMEITPSIIQKHWEQVWKKWNNPIIYVQPTLLSYNRKRLIDLHIPFIIPGNQMYLPHCGIDLREHFRKIHNKKHKIFSPGTQAAIIYVLLYQTNGKLTPSIVAEKLGYTLMTMSRAFDELQAAEIGIFARERRERYWIFPDKQTLWEQAKPFLRNPIKKRIWIKNYSFKTLAGLSALSHLSQLAPPSLPIFAIGLNQWNDLKHLDIQELPTSENACLELEIWAYNPELFAKNGIVDPFSLYLSLESIEDERVELALEEMMEKIKW